MVDHEIYKNLNYKEKLKRDILGFIFNMFFIVFIFFKVFPFYIAVALAIVIILIDVITIGSNCKKYKESTEID